MDNKLDEEFWNLKELYVPQKKIQKRSKVDLSSIDVEMDLENSDSNKSYPIPPRKDDEIKQTSKQASVGESYIVDNSLLKKIVITPWTGYIKMYDLFDHEVENNYLLEKEKAPLVMFDNNINLYSSMDKSQFNYYIYWRTELRKHNYIRATRSYLLVYINECISSLSFIVANKIISDLIEVWLNYREEFIYLDKTFAETITDICLTKRVRPTKEEILKLRVTFEKILLPEVFFLPDLSNLDFEYIQNMIGYSYKTNKFYMMKKEVFDSIIPNLAIKKIKELLLNDEFIDSQVLSHELKESYSGLSVSIKNKRWISCSYISIRKNISLKNMIIMIIKCCENAIRDRLGIKTKYVLSPRLPYDIEDEIKEYVSNQGFSPIRVIDKEPEYMKYYEKKSFDKADSSRAKMIEIEAWETAKILGEEFEDIEQKPVENQNVSVTHDYENEYDELYSKLDNQLKQSIIALINGELDSFCKENKLIKEEIIRKINDMSFDITGDILIENEEIIEDYKEEIEKYVKEDDK